MSIIDTKLASNKKTNIPSKLSVIDYHFITNTKIMNNIITVFQSSCSKQELENITQITSQISRLMKKNNNDFLSTLINKSNAHVLTNGNDTWDFNDMYNDVHVVNEIKKLGKKAKEITRTIDFILERKF